MNRSLPIRPLLALLLLSALSVCGCADRRARLTAPDDPAVAADRELVDSLQRETFAYMRDHAYAESGLVYENNRYADGPATIGGTGFGVAALVVATDRGWISRRQAVDRLRKIVTFLRDRTDRQRLHGAFPHWVNGVTGETMPFGPRDIGADIVETSFLMQGLLIARAYFDGPGDEAELRSIITELWRDVDWNWFTRGENNGLYWHWSPEYGFDMNFRVSGFNECLVTYVLAAASPTRPISPEATRFWYSTDEYQPTGGNGYTVEAGIPYTGPLFIIHYSFIGLDPRRLADDHVPSGYWKRNVTQTLINRAYCLESAPAENRYGDGYWGLTSSDARDFYRYSAPGNDSGTVAPTAALSSMPYTPEYSMRVLHNLNDRYRDALWGPCGPYDAFSLRDDWFARTYQAIDQLPIVCMIENYRSGLLWKLFMGDADVRRGLERMGLHEPVRRAGFPDMVVTLKPAAEADSWEADACDLRRHPDTGLYTVPCFTGQVGPATFVIRDAAGTTLWKGRIRTGRDGGALTFPLAPPLTRHTGEILTLTLRQDGEEWSLPVRLN